MRREDNLHVICLVRADNNDIAKERVEATIKQYSIQCHPVRWSAIAGDLAQENLGLSQSGWSSLVNCISVVFHAGSIVNASLPLGAIRSTNVSGTKTIVELCVAANAELHYISSASVLGGSGITEEILDVPPPRKHSTAYAKSKWLSEQIVRLGVTELGLRARLYRLGTMGCHSKTGACNSNDSFTRILEGIISLETITKDGDFPLPKGFYLAPIDWAMKSLCTIALKSSNEINDLLHKKKDKHRIEKAEVFHIISNHCMPISTAYNAIVRRGMTLTTVSASEFKEKLGTMLESNPMYAFRDVFNGRAPERLSSLPLSTEKTCTFTDSCPTVDENVIVKMLQFLGH